MYSEVLLPVDLSVPASWKKALPTAIDVCRTYGGRLHVLTVVPDFGFGAVGQYFPDDVEKRILEQSDAALRAFVEDNVPDDVSAGYRVGQGVVYKEILAHARDVGVDLVVMASHSPEFANFLLGPNAARVVRHAGCSVWVVRH